MKKFVNNHDAFIREWIKSPAKSFSRDPLNTAWNAKGNQKMQLDMYAMPEPFYGSPLKEILTVVFTINPGGSGPSQQISNLSVGHIVKEVTNSSYSHCTDLATWGLAKETKDWFIKWKTWLNTFSSNEDINHVNFDLIKWHSKNAGKVNVTPKIADIILKKSIFSAATLVQRHGLPSIFKQNNKVLFVVKTKNASQIISDVLNKNTITKKNWKFHSVFKTNKKPRVTYELLTVDLKDKNKEITIETNDFSFKSEIGFLCMWGSPSSLPLSSSWNEEVIKGLRRLGW